jgi:hypothetical protein
VSRAELWYPDRDLAQAEPPVLPRRCESCSQTGLPVYVPNGLGGGRRVCWACLGVMDALRARQGTPA